MKPEVTQRNTKSQILEADEKLLAKVQAKTEDNPKEV